MVKLLIKRGYSVVTLDNLSSGFRDAVLGGQFVQGDINDSELLDNLLSQHQFDGVMHFASYIQVGESVEAPAKYYGNNFSNTLNLLNAMVKHNVRAFIFSSTAAIFG
jgi:UDP-glucose 4-epimerase